MFLWPQLTLTQKDILSVRVLLSPGDCGRSWSLLLRLLWLLLLLRRDRVASTSSPQSDLKHRSPILPLTENLSIDDCDLPYQPYTHNQTTRQDGETRTRRWWKGAAAANQLHFQASSDPRKGLDMAVRTAGHSYRGYHQSPSCCHLIPSARMLIKYTGLR